MNYFYCKNCNGVYDVKYVKSHMCVKCEKCDYYFASIISFNCHDCYHKKPVNLSEIYGEIDFDDFFKK